MNTDEIRAALAAATPGPWDAKPLGSEGYAVTGAPDPDAPGVRAKMRRRIARFGYQDWDTDRANAELVAKAPTWLAELLAEVDRLREEARAFAEALGFGDGRTEPAATLAQMIDPLTEAMSMARDHIECAVMCELCGEVLAGEWCEECHGSGCLPNAELTYLECGTCAGAGRIHVGCAEASYAGLAARAEAAEQAVRRVRTMANGWLRLSLQAIDPDVREWTGAAGRSVLEALDGGEQHG